jgi:2-oxoglutarate dehydrogenase complex dehydrogenase (E1) component-like enzyme
MASSIPIQVTGQDIERLTDEQRELVAVAAYYLAERRNFKPGHETEDWLAAESQVRSLTTLSS